MALCKYKLDIFWDFPRNSSYFPVWDFAIQIGATHFVEVFPEIFKYCGYCSFEPGWFWLFASEIFGDFLAMFIDLQESQFHDSVGADVKSGRFDIQKYNRPVKYDINERKTGLTGIRSIFFCHGS